MLTKNSELHIDPDKPFENDCLDRRQCIFDLTNLIQSANQPFVISVEGPWGSGKTTFVKMWEAYLEQQDHPCLYFNAWETDFSEDPLISFISEMGRLLEKEKDEGKTANLKAALRKAQCIGGGLLRKGVPVALKVATQGLINIDEETLAQLKGASDDIGELVGELAKERIALYEREREGIDAFRKSLGDFAKLIGEDQERKSPVVFFVDEMDRCRPDYAIALLERIKHLFNVQGVVFILSIDRAQLESSVRAIYGSDIYADGYLRRFIDLRYKLPEPDMGKFFYLLYQRFAIEEYFNSRTGDQGRDQFEEAFPVLAKHLKLSLRDLEQCFTEINILLHTTGQQNRVYGELIPFLIIIKSKRPDLYSLMQNKNANVDDIVEKARPIFQGEKYLEQTYGPLIEAYIIANYSDEKTPSKFLKEHQSLVEAPVSEDDTTASRRANWILRMLTQFQYSNAEKAINRMISRIDRLGNFITK